MTKYILVWETDGEILGKDMTYQDIYKYCQKENAYMVRFKDEPDEYGDRWAYIEYHD